MFDDSYTFHTKIYCDVFNFMKNVLNRARTGTCATTGTFTLRIKKTHLQKKNKLFVNPTLLPEGIGKRRFHTDSNDGANTIYAIAYTVEIYHGSLIPSSLC